MDERLGRGLKRLMVVRVLVVTALLTIAVSIEAGAEQLEPVNPLYLVIVATYLVTVVHGLMLRWMGPRPVLVYVQVVGDLSIISGLLYVTGSPHIGFNLLYPISVLSGSAMLIRGRGLALALIATIFYAALAGAVRMGVIASHGLGDIGDLSGPAFAYSMVVMGVACGTVAVIGGQLSESLRSAGEQVADLRQLNEVLLRSIQSGLLMADRAGRILYTNRFGESILGLAAAALHGRAVADVFGSALFEATTLNAQAADRRLARLAVPYLRPDGQRLELGISVTPLAVTDPARKGLLFVFQDLTEVRRVERETGMKEKLAAMGEMAAHLAHEIRNPLGSISGSAQMLIAEGSLSADQAQLLAIIHRESRRLSETLGQFLLQARSPARSPGTVDLGPVLAEAVTLLRNGPEVAAGHTVEFEADEGPHLCVADPDQLRQVFWNLARNGLEAMPEGGLLKVRLATVGNDVLLSVRDQGRGIGPEDMQRMFEPFHSRKGRGTGLGLAIAYRIVCEHQGDIAIRSLPAQGTEVEVRLPLVSVPVAV